jgi:uroporphyrinogen-III synthase
VSPPSTQKPLNGTTVLITRPQPGSQQLAEAISKAGGTPVQAPMLEIQPYADPAGMRELHAKFSSYAGVIFISPNAVKHGLPVVRRLGLGQKTLFAIGHGTRQSIVDSLVDDASVTLKMPLKVFNSEGLLDLEEFNASTVTGKRFLIMRGNGGREYLADTLKQRGASVDYLATYERIPTEKSLASVLQEHQVENPAIGVITSVEGLQILAKKISTEGLQRLFQMPLVVAGSRIAHELENHGFTNPPLIADNPSQENIIARLMRWVVEKI